MELIGQAFGVERPAFAVAAVPEIAADRGNAFIFERDRALEVVAGNCFVEGGGFVFDAAVLFGLIGVDEENAGAAAVFGGRVVFVGAVFLAEGGIGLNDDVGFGPEAEGGGGFFFGARERGLGIGDQSGAIFEQILFVGAEFFEKRRDVAGVEGFFGDVFHFGGDFVDFFQAELVDLRGGNGERAEVAHGGVIAGGAVGIRRDGG